MAPVSGHVYRFEGRRRPVWRAKYRDSTRHAEKVHEGDAAVRFKPCPPDTPAFTGGNVGPITGWAGALITTGPRCVRLELRIDGRRRPDIRLPLGRRCR